MLEPRPEMRTATRLRARAIRLPRSAGASAPPSSVWAVVRPNRRPHNAGRPMDRCLAWRPSRFMCDNSALPGVYLSIPNLITLARILSVPIMVWAIASDWMLLAFMIFVAAGVSDLVDGYLAKRFGMTSELGAYLD